MVLKKLHDGPVSLSRLSRRERQVMEIVYQRGKVTAAEVMEAMPDSPSYSAVRASLRVLEEKGHLRHEAEDLKYVYLPTVTPEKARKSAVKHLLETLFSESPGELMSALMDVSARQLTDAELDRMSAMIDKARQEGK